MTYGLAFATETFVGIATDRRLSSPTTLQDDEDKCGLIVMKGAHLGFTMSGLATVPRLAKGKWVEDFVASKWIAEHLCRAARDRGLDDMLHEFARLASLEISRISSRVSPEDRRLTVILGGFVDNGDHRRRRPVLRTVSNYQEFGKESTAKALPEFKVSGIDMPPDKICVTWTGSASPKNEQLESIAGLIQSRPPIAAINRMTEIIRYEAARNSTIGDWCSSLIIPREPQFGSLADYHPGAALKDLRAPAFIYARYDDMGAWATVGGAATLEYDDVNSVARMPPSQRNKPCKCGSKRAYKKCHGKAPKATVIELRMDKITVQEPHPDVPTWIYKTDDNYLIFGPDDATLRIVVNGKPRWMRES